MLIINKNINELKFNKNILNSKLDVKFHFIINYYLNSFIIKILNKYFEHYPLTHFLSVVIPH